MNPTSRANAESIKALVKFYQDFSIDENITSVINLIGELRQSKANGADEMPKCLLEEQLMVSAVVLQRKLRCQLAQNQPHVLS